MPITHDASTPIPWTRPRRRFAQLVAISASVTAVLGVTSTAAVVASARSTPSAAAPAERSSVASLVPGNTALPAACRPAKNPPPTEYGFVARVHDGTITGSRLSVTDIDMSICGVITVVNAEPGSGCDGIQGQLRIPAEGVVLNTIDARLTLIPGERPKIPVTLGAYPIRQTIVCDSETDGFKVDLDLRVDGRAGIFGLGCAVPFNGVAHSKISGPLLTPPYESEQTLSGTFAAKKVSNNDKYCPGLLPGRINRIAGLPDNDFKVSLPTKVSIYQNP